MRRTALLVASIATCAAAMTLMGCVAGQQRRMATPAPSAMPSPVAVAHDRAAHQQERPRLEVARAVPSTAMASPKSAVSSAPVLSDADLASITMRPNSRVTPAAKPSVAVSRPATGVAPKTISPLDLGSVTDADLPAIATPKPVVVPPVRVTPRTADVLPPLPARTFKAPATPSHTPACAKAKRVVKPACGEGECVGGNCGVPPVCPDFAAPAYDECDNQCVGGNCGVPPAAK